MELQQPALRKRRSDGQQVLKIQEKVVVQRSSNYQGTKAPAEGLQERPGGGGTTRPWRARRDTRKDLGAEKHHGLEGPAEGPTEELPEGPAGNGRKIQRRGCRKVPRWICRKGQRRICRKAQRGSCRKGQQRSGKKIQQRHRSQVRRMEATWQACRERAAERTARLGSFTSGL